MSSGVIRPIHLYLTYRNKIYTMRLLMLSIKTSSSSFRSLFEKVHDTQLVLSFSLRSDKSKCFVQVPMNSFWSGHKNFSYLITFTRTEPEEFAIS